MMKLMMDSLVDADSNQIAKIKGTSETNAAPIQNEPGCELSGNFFDMSNVLAQGRAACGASPGATGWAAVAPSDAAGTIRNASCTALRTFSSAGM